MKKRLISIFLVCLMVFSLLPVSVFATPDGTPITEATTISTSGTYYLDNDVAGTIKITGGDVVIDLNGKTLKQSGSTFYYDSCLYITGGNVTITDSIGGGKVWKDCNTANSNAIYASNCTLTLNGGTYEQTGSSACPIYVVGTTYINAGVTVVGGSKGDITSAGMLEINGGSFGGKVGVSNQGTMYINGGTFAGAVTADAGSICRIRGGEFSVDPSPYLYYAKAEKNEQTGKWTVSHDGEPPVGDYAAVIGSVGYETLAEAIGAVKTGETIKLLKNSSQDAVFADMAVAGTINSWTTAGGKYQSEFQTAQIATYLSGDKEALPKFYAKMLADPELVIKNVTLDLNGCELSGDVEVMFTNLTVCDKSDGAAGEVGGDFTISDVSDVVIDGGTYAFVTLATLMYGNEKLTINDGSFIGENWSPLQIPCGDVTINGGSFSSSSDVAVYVYSDEYSGGKANVTVNGGYFSGGAKNTNYSTGEVYYQNAVIQIPEADYENVALKGGYFNNDVFAGGTYADRSAQLSTLVADGYEKVDNADPETKTSYPYKVQGVVTVSGFAMAKNSYVYDDALSVNDAAKNVMVGENDVTSEIDGWTVAYFKNTGTEQAPVWTDAGAAPYPVGSYKAVVSIADDMYGGTQELLFSIAAKPLTISADNKSALVGADQPALTYTVSGLVGSDTLTAEPTLSCAPNMSVAGSYNITVSGGSASGNYTIATYTPGKLTVLKASQSAPAKGEGYTITGTTLTAADGYELYDGTSTATSFTITAGQTYFVRKIENAGHFASPYTAIDTTVSVAAIASPASMGMVSIGGVTNGKCQIGASVTATATAKSGYEFVKWVSGSEEKTENPYTFTATASTTLTAVFKVKDKQVATLPTVAPAESRVYTGSSITGVSGGTGCTLSGTTSAESVGTYTATATLTNTTEYVWPDGTTAPKTITWVIYKASQTAPTVTVEENVIKVTAVEGKTAQYMAKDGAEYKAIPSEAVPAGTYYVRFAADSNHLASPAVVVTVSLPTITVTTIQPSVLGETSATLNGIVAPYDATRITGVGFEYKADGADDWTKATAETPAASFSKGLTGLTAGTKYVACAYVTTSERTIYGAQTTFYTLEAAATGEIDVFLDKDDGREVTLTIEKGNAAIASVTLIDNTWKFNALTDGFYNIVVRTTDGDFTETRLVEVTGGKVVASSFSIPAGKIATVVEVKGEDTPPVAVGGLTEILTTDDKDAAAAGNLDVEIKLEAQKEATVSNMEAEPDTTQYAVAQIEKLIPEATATVEEKIETVLDLSLIKTTTELKNDEVKSVEVKDIGSENDKVIEVAVPYATAGKTLKVYRYHDGVAEELRLLSSRPSANFIDGTYFVGDGYVFIYASGFSTYAISYEETKTVSGGGGGVAYYAVSAASATHGKVTVDKASASAGSTVTITVAPEKGFTLETLTVKDAKGNEVALTAVKTGETYTFKMPSSKVTVSATFMEDNSMLNFFVDVKATDYYYDAVLWAAENDITKGTDAVHFSPDMGTTRAQVVTFLWRAAGCPDPKGDASKFVDVPANEYYAKAVAWAIEQGITKGTSESTFSPDSVCTRGQIVTFLARFAGVADEATGYTHGFIDVKSTDYFNNAVAWAKDNKVTEGTSATTFSPNVDCTRAQVVTFLYRWMVK